MRQIFGRTITFHFQLSILNSLLDTLPPPSGTPPNLGGEFLSNSPSKLEGVAEGRGRVSFVVRR